MIYVCSKYSFISFLLIHYKTHAIKIMWFILFCYTVLIMNLNILILDFDNFYNEHKSYIILSNRLSDLPEDTNILLQNEFSYFLKNNSNDNDPAKTFYNTTKFGNNFHNQSYSPYSQSDVITDNLYFDAFEEFFRDIIIFSLRI